ncbi:ATP-utilizing chromatin assembly and remodelling N-terminal-domain-containing protein [Pilobolus umbonatus]|nr:ATP-utilizing chromatin assembly and remodelling N-terminal-domain-containing protein [Pilobolus umbonatus]
MPLLNHKRVPLMEAIPYDPKKKRKEVWYLRFTNEVFTNYEDYINKLTLYQQSIWECEVTGRQNLTYEQALESERGEVNRVEYRFSEALRKDMLLRIQFQTVQLEGLVDNIFNYYQNHYVIGEIVRCTLCNYDYYARILDIIPAQPYWNNASTKQHQIPHSDSSGSISSMDEDHSQRPNGRLRFPDAFLISTPSEETPVERDVDEIHIQRYKIQLLDNQGQPLESYDRIVDGDIIKRDPIIFNRRNIQNLIRECCYKDQYIGAPWKIKSDVSAAYNKTIKLPEEIPAPQEPSCSRKRKQKIFIIKTPDEKEAEKRARKEEQSLMKARMKEEKERQRQERKKQSAVKYPVEDLDLPIYRKDPNLNWILIDMSPHKYDNKSGHIPYPSGGRPPRPIPHQDDIIPPQLFDSFLSVWAFLTIFAEPLKISAYSIDDFQRALFHTSQQPKQTLLVEYMTGLLNVIISERKDDTMNDLINGDVMDNYVDARDGDVKVKMEETDMSLEKNEKHSNEEKCKRHWRSKEMLRICHKWDTRELRANYDRRGWETALVGCLNDIATPDMIPDLDDLLLHLVPRMNTTASDRERQYPTLSLKQKLDILVFLVDTVNGSNLIKNYMEYCQEQLSELRKQKVEVNKESKALAMKRIELSKQCRNGAYERDEEVGEENEVEDENQDSENDTDSADSDHMSVSSNRQLAAGEEKHQSRQKTKENQEKVETESSRKKEHAEQRVVTKTRGHELKQKLDQRRKIEEKEKLLRKKEEHIERCMHRYMTLRICPLGKDRFYNRYFYLDNVGVSNTSGSGRLYIHSPTDTDIEMMIEREYQGDIHEQPWGHGGGCWFIISLMREQGLMEESEWLERRMNELRSGNPTPYVGWWKYYDETDEVGL